MHNAFVRSNVGVVAKVEAALGAVLGARAPVEGYKDLVSRQSAGGQVHTVEVAGDALQEGGVKAEDADVAVESVGGERCVSDG